MPPWGAGPRPKAKTVPWDTPTRDRGFIPKSQGGLAPDSVPNRDRGFIPQSQGGLAPNAGGLINKGGGRYLPVPTDEQRNRLRMSRAVHSGMLDNAGGPPGTGSSAAAAAPSYNMGDIRKAATSGAFGGPPNTQTGPPTTAPPFLGAGPPTYTPPTPPTTAPPFLGAGPPTYTPPSTAPPFLGAGPPTYSPPTTAPPFLGAGPPTYSPPPTTTAPPFLGAGPPTYSPPESSVPPFLGVGPPTYATPPATTAPPFLGAGPPTYGSPESSAPPFLGAGPPTYGSDPGGGMGDGGGAGGGGGFDGSGGGAGAGGGGAPAPIVRPNEGTVSPFGDGFGDLQRKMARYQFLEEKYGREGARYMTDLERSYKKGLRALPGTYNRRGMLDSGQFDRGGTELFADYYGDDYGALPRYLSTLGENLYGLDLGAYGTQDAYNVTGEADLQNRAKALIERMTNLNNPVAGSAGPAYGPPR